MNRQKQLIVSDSRNLIQINHDGDGNEDMEKQKI